MTQEQKRRGFLQQVLRFVPGDCPVCGIRTPGGLLCAACTAEIVDSMRVATRLPLLSQVAGQKGGFRCSLCQLRLPAPMPCPDCATRHLAVSRVFAAFDYDVAAGRQLVRRFKQGRQFVLSRALAQLMAAEVRRHGGLQGDHRNLVLMPLPAHQASIRERGFSPAAELARDLARELELPCRTGWLVRCNEGMRQTGQTRRHRLALAHAEAYRCRPFPEGTGVVLVDDVMTTGSTLHQAARALRQAGAADVMAIVLARAPLRDGIRIPARECAGMTCNIG